MSMRGWLHTRSRIHGSVVLSSMACSASGPQCGWRSTLPANTLLSRGWMLTARASVESSAVGFAATRAACCMCGSAHRLSLTSSGAACGLEPTASTAACLTPGVWSRIQPTQRSRNAMDMTGRMQAPNTVSARAEFDFCRNTSLSTSSSVRFGFDARYASTSGRWAAIRPVRSGPEAVRMYSMSSLVRGSCAPMMRADGSASMGGITSSDPAEPFFVSYWPPSGVPFGLWLLLFLSITMMASRRSVAFRHVPMRPRAAGGASPCRAAR